MGIAIVFAILSALFAIAATVIGIMELRARRAERNHKA
jgi:hypothetical protein